MWQYQVVPGPDVTAAELWEWILDHAEEVDGRLLCREPIWGYLGERGVPEDRGRVRMRTRLVKELTAEGKVIREHPRSGRLYILDETASASPRVVEGSESSRTRATTRTSRS